jgi:hypothetical protein
VEAVDKENSSSHIIYRRGVGCAEGRGALEMGKNSGKRRKRSGERQLQQTRRLIKYSGGDGTLRKSVEKMPFIERVIVVSLKPLESDTIASHERVTISGFKDLQNHSNLISDPCRHPIGHTSPTISLATGKKRVLYVDCLETQARTLGCTFARMQRYCGKSGSLKRASFTMIIDNDDAKLMGRVEFVVDRLCQFYGPFECLSVGTGGSTGNRLTENMAVSNIPMPGCDDDPEEIVRWTGLVANNCTGINSISGDAKTIFHVYSSERGGLVSGEDVLRLSSAADVVCVVAVSAACAHPYADQPIPPLPHTLPPSIVWYKEGAAGRSIVINYI